MKIKRQYGPWAGYSSSRSRFTIPKDHMGPDSLNALLNPLERYAYRRGGTSATGIGATTGVLETVVADATMKSMQAFPLVSPSLSDSYPAWAVLWADEDKKKGQIGFRSSNGSDTDQLPALSFGSTHYTLTGGSTSTINDFRMIPMPYIHNATGYTRGVIAENRARFASGSRRVEQVGDDLQMPNYFATPYRWKNRRFNDAVGSGSEDEIHLPLGHIPPLWAATITEPTGQTAVASWIAGNSFYHAVAFMDQNGALSMPSVPRAPQTAGLTAGLGLKTIASTSAYYVSMTWTIPIGPPGTKARVLLRSPQKSATAAPYVSPDPLDMRVTAIVLNNTATTYSDPNGGDGGLLIDAERVRWDHRSPPSGRWMWTFDQRLAIGDLTPSPAAMYLAPTGKVASRDLNAADDSQTVYSVSNTWSVSVQPNRILLRWTDTAGATTSQKIDLAAGTTIQQIVDTINATTVASAAKEWAAALALGADGNAPSTSLAPTSQNVVCATTDTLTTVTSAALFGPVAVGTKVFGTGMPADVYVKSIETTSSLTLSAAATATGAPTLTFYSDVGDDWRVIAIADATYAANIDKYGNQRVICAALPMLVGFTKSYLDAFPARPYSLAYTGASPGHPPNAANNWYQDNELSIPSTIGRFMAAGHVSSGNIVSLVAFSEGIAVIRNMRGGGTALDSDYRLLSTASRRGCISPPSFVQGNGWCGWLSQEGFVISQGEADGEVVISAECFLQSESGGVGDWAYEVGQCAAATASSGTGWGFHAFTASGRLWVSYRFSASVRVVQCYDFSAGLGSSGVAEVVKDDGTPWGWSPKLTYNWNTLAVSAGVAVAPGASVNAMCAVRKSDGLYLIAADDNQTVGSPTTCGRVCRFENGTFIDGASTEVTGQINTLTDRCDTFDKKAILNVTSMHSCPSAGATISVYRRYDRSAVGTLTLATTADAFKVLRMEVPQRERTLTDQIEHVVNIPTGVGAMKHWGLETEVEVVANAR